MSSNTSSTSSSSWLANIKQKLSKGDFQGAINLCNKLLAEDLDRTNYCEVLYFLTVALRYCKRLSEAEKSIKTLLEKDPLHARGLQELGHLSLAMGQSERATKAFYDATRQNPALIASWRQLVSLYEQVTNVPAKALEQARNSLRFWANMPKPVLGAADLLFNGDETTADQVCRRFLQQHKHHPDGLYVLAMIDIKKGNYDEAEFLLDSCLVLQPQHVQARAELAALLNRIGKFEQAFEHAETLLAASPEDCSAQVVYAVAEVGLGNVEKGIQVFERVLEKEPHRASVWLQLGHAQKALGRMKEAVTSYQSALKYRKNYGDVYWSLANMKTYRFSDEEMSEMERAISQQDMSQEDATHIMFALAKGFEDQGELEKGFSFYKRANQHQFSNSDYRADHVSRQIDDQIDFFTHDFFAQRTEYGIADTSPIFIVGLPRSGSTLIEQILSTHSKVDATQELQFILTIAKRIRQQGAFPQNLTDISGDTFTKLGQKFLQDTQVYRGNGLYFIDKMPNNFLHVGLIKLMLPNAKIIDARRDPMDCCFSCYKQLFAEGQDFTYDLVALGQFYRDYVRLMEHWDQVLPGFVLRIQHEDVLDNLEAQTRRILAFCGLDFESQCLEFYNHQRAVQTPSAAQVRRPINRDGVGKWEAVEDKLEALKNALRPILAR